MIIPPVAIIEAPSVLGLFPRGVETLPNALLTAGLAERLGARRAGRVEPPPYDDRKDPETGMLNPRSIATYTGALAEAVGQTLDAGEFPVVLGGDCSIMLGPLLALRRRGRSGLLFMDGHADFYQPAAEPSGEAASMELAIATGRGPTIVTDLDGLRPLVRESDVVVFGRRDAEDAEKDGSQRIEDTVISMFDLDSIRASGADGASGLATAHLTRPELDGFWIHFDVDVLDDAVMPAVDYRLPCGLSWDEVITTLRSALESNRAIGLDVTIFNPRLDTTGALTDALVDGLAAALRPT